MERDQDLKVRENRLRRAAERQGLRLSKSRVRDPRGIGYGTYSLTNPWASNAVVVGYGWCNGYGASLDEIESHLVGGE